MNAWHISTFTPPPPQKKLLLKCLSLKRASGVLSIHFRLLYFYKSLSGNVPTYPSLFFFRKCAIVGLCVGFDKHSQQILGSCPCKMDSLEALPVYLPPKCLPHASLFTLHKSNHTKCLTQKLHLYNHSKCTLHLSMTHIFIFGGMAFEIGVGIQHLILIAFSQWHSRLDLALRSACLRTCHR